MSTIVYIYNCLYVHMLSERKKERKKDRHLRQCTIVLVLSCYSYYTAIMIPLLHVHVHVHLVI